MMTETLDETEIKKKLLAELQGQMAGRRVSPVLSISLDPGSAVREGESPTDEYNERKAADPNSVVREGELDEPTDVKSRLGNLLKKRGMM